MEDEQRARDREERLKKRNERRRARGEPEIVPGLFAWDGQIADDGPTIIRGPLEPAASASEPQRGLGRSTAIFSLATALSRVLGLVREMVASYYFGAAGRINAFTIAFQFPNLVRALVADAALSSAFVPVFSELIENGERKRAWRVASSLFWLMLLGLTALSAVFVLVAPWIIGIFGNPGHDRSLTVGLSRVLFPIVALLGVSGIVVGILNAYDHFSVPAISPVFWNLAIVAGLAIGVPQAHSSSSKLYVYAFAILVATFIQVFLPMPWLRGLDRGEERLRVVLDWRDPMVKKTFKLMLPVTLGLGLINVNALIDVFFASRLIDGNLAPTAIQKAFLVYMLPQGMFSVAIATVLFPSLSRLATRGDIAGFREAVARGMRQIAFLLVPAAAVSAVLAEPIVRILFQRGQWTSDQTPVAAACLAAFSGGLAFNGAMLLLNRGFFSLQENWVPTAVALANLFLNAILDLIFYRYGTWGIPLSTAIVNVAGTAALVVLMRRRIGGIEGRRTLSAVARVAAASAALAGVAYGIWEPLDAALGRSFPAQAVSLGAALVAGVAAYLGSCRLLRVTELDVLLGVVRRFRRA
ncbi:MAG TPA: murein biosynthesis integral membrane protein MurJ [Gaiellaceae bacterium]